jgi:hypothetical protein
MFEFIKPQIGSYVWSVSGCNLKKLKVISHETDDYFTCETSDGSTCHINVKSFHKWWDYSKDDAKLCVFAITI